MSAGHHHHHHSHDAPPVSVVTRRRLTVVLTPFVVATLIGIVLLWPSDRTIDVEGMGGAGQPTFSAEVTEVDRAPCEQAGQERFDCAVVSAKLAEGPEEGDTVLLNVAEGVNARHVEVGDRILVGRSEGAGQASANTYFFSDYERSGTLVVLVLLFAIVVIALSRMHGFYSLIGVGASLGILILFVLPAILEGSSPVAVALVGGSAIMFVTLYLAHGFNAMTTTAVLGTLASLAITGTLAVIFVEAAKFTGFGSEEAVFLQVAAQQINLEGLLLGSIVIGTLGVLDDVTVTQASAVWQLHAANPTLGTRGLFRSAVRIGRDHIASTVNTLVLAYAGASLPLLVLFVMAGRPFGNVVTSEVVAEEIVRTLVGSIGLVASVPITTALAAAVASGEPASRPAQPHDHGPHGEPLGPPVATEVPPGTAPTSEADRAEIGSDPADVDLSDGDLDALDEHRPRGERFFRDE